MSDLFRDAPLGQLIRFVTKNRVLQYPEEKSSFECPNSYAHPDSSDFAEKEAPSRSRSHSQAQSAIAGKSENGSNSEMDVPSDLIPARSELLEETEGEKKVEEQEMPEPATTLEPISSSTSSASTIDPDTEPVHALESTRTGLSKVGTRTALSQSHTRADLEAAFTASTIAKGPTRPIAPERLNDGTILVDWYTTDDPANPQNWSLGKKSFVTLQICLYTLAVYMGSAIYAPSEVGIMAEFGVSIQVAALGLSMYVLAYGMGPLIFSPLSELPLIGRNPPYMITFALFVILLVPTALVENMAGLVVLRFLLGFFGSPCLATGGASLQDMFSLIKLPYVLSLWAISATSGPALGPIISGFSVTAENWRWSQWEMLWLAGPVFIVMFLFLPETSPSNILLRRAERLRAVTGDNRLRAQSEIDQANLKLNDLVVESLWRPLQMMFLDPAIAFAHGYTALIYGIFYSFFEAFPLVYEAMYGFNLGEMGLTFLSITVGVVLAVAGYWAYVYWIVEPEIRKNGLGAPERRLIPALFVAFFLPVGLFIFAWTSRPSVHWIVSVIGIMIFTIGIFLIIQCLFLYLPLTYPQYAASLFAGNDFARSTLAAGAVHFSQPLFHNLGIGSGVSLLAALTAGCIVGIYVLYFYGDRLRAKSRFAAK